jgi:ribosome-binding protein aMBF1 (putative translation factor)
MQHENQPIYIKSMQDWEQLYLTKPTNTKSTTTTTNTKSITKNHSETQDVVLKKPSLDFQKTLQQARLSQKMTQKDLALKAGIQLNILQGYENGKEIPSNLIISKLEKLLNTKLPRIYKKE